MRTKRVLAGRRRLLGVAGIPGVILIIAVTAAGCSGSSASSSGGSSAAALGGAPVEAPAASAAPTAAGAPANGFAAGSGSSARSASTAKFAASGQQLIETAQLSVRAKNVADAVSSATAIVTDAGGYVSAENASAGQGNPSQATATVTFKIPAAVYQTTLATLTRAGLGTQLSLSQQAQDVTQQVADVGSRVTSDQAAIAQLRALLAHAGSVGELLSVQDQINSEESDLESMLAQQSALNHETSYATLTLSLVGPKAVAKAHPKQAPPGLSGGLVPRLARVPADDQLAADRARRGGTVRRGGAGRRRPRLVGAAADRPRPAAARHPGRRLGRRRGLRPSGSRTAGYGAMVLEPVARGHLPGPVRPCVTRARRRAPRRAYGGRCRRGSRPGCAACASAPRR